MSCFDLSKEQELEEKKHVRKQQLVRRVQLVSTRVRLMCDAQ
jgi:hypothetical protein